ncbi:MAG: ketoacyl-ACP synthase III [Clostridiaceae bacterium]|nr:ketoacyl-ACP synthase III [Clostridiaceae bacterium]
MINSTIISTGSYSPDFIVKNDDLSKIMDTSDEWIKSRTGIEERRISINENTSDLAYKAALDAINNSDITCDDIDLIIVATVTPDMHMPSTACLLQNKLGAKNATAFDITAACSGFIYGLSIADSMIKSGRHNTVLIVGAEVLSKSINWEDRSTAVLFGDGAGAVILRGTKEEQGIISICTKSEGEDGQVLAIGDKSVKNPFSEDSEERLPYIIMNGREVLRFSTRVIVDSIKEVLKKGNTTLEEVKWIVPHQANARIIKHAAQKLGIEDKKFFMNLQKFGNTSSASIPKALNEMNRKGMLSKGDKIILVGFGGGLTYGSILIEW